MPKIPKQADDTAKRPKRGHGEGSISQRPDGTWVGSIMLGRKVDGKPDRPKVYARTRAEVQKQLAALRRKAEEGTRVDPSKERQTVADYMARWLDASTSTRPQTLDGYRQVTRKHILPAIGHRKLSALRPDDIQALYARKLNEPAGAGRPLAPSTVAKVHIVLHRALAMAVRWGYIPHNSADAVDRPSVPKRDMRALEPLELVRLVEAAQAAEDPLSTLWLLAMHTGCREGELLGLAWSDVDLDRGTLTVRRTLVGTHNQTPRYGEPKSQTSRRTLSLPAEAVQALRSHKAQQSKERLAAREWADNSLVFCSHLGRHCSAATSYAPSSQHCDGPGCPSQSASTISATLTPRCYCAPACP